MEPLQTGVCSWSLGVPSLADALASIRDNLRIRLVQVGFMDDSYQDADKVIGVIRESGVEVSATCLGFAGEDYSTIQRIAATGGYLPDADWADRYRKTLAVAEITARLGVKLLAAHIGFVPHDRGDAKYAVMVERVQMVCDGLAQHGLTLLMETGQEKAEDLLAFIDAVGRPNVGVNFDPANMVLYGVGEPIDALGLLLPHVKHVHMKDATWSKRPGESWGEEVVLGTGDADIPRIVSKLRSGGYRGPLVIEREAGGQRLIDIAEARDLLQSLLPG